MFKMNPTEWRALIERVLHDPDTGCWVWQGARDDRGYGVLRFRGHLERAHRLALGQLLGRMPHPMALHRCDNPACCNPRHLYEGNARDNARDCWERGRRTGAMVQGVRNGRARLTPALVLEIRAAEGTLRGIAREHGVAPSTVAAVRARRTWRHVEVRDA